MITNILFGFIKSLIRLSKIANLKKHLENKIYWINVSAENLEQKSFYKIFSNLVKKNNLENLNFQNTWINVNQNLLSILNEN